MIKKFGFRNFDSFKDGTELNFVSKGHAAMETAEGFDIGT
ncbi:MAG: hypothetical protein ACI8WB_006245, partial [Phenylobacterium sp.]